MADGFAEPGWFHMFRMLVGEIDAAREMIALPYHPDLLRSLEEIHGLEKKELARHAPRPAARLGGEGNRHHTAQHLFIRCLHPLRARLPMVVFAGESPINAKFYNQYIDQAPLVTANVASPTRTT